MFEYQFEQFIKPHNSLRVFLRFPPISEIDSEFPLLPNTISFQDSLDPRSSDDIEVIHYEFLSKTPGLFGIHAMNPWKIEIASYFKERLMKTYGKMRIL